jgi:hypothetical protein
MAVKYKSPPVPHVPHTGKKSPTGKNHKPLMLQIGAPGFEPGTFGSQIQRQGF